MNIESATPAQRAAIESNSKEILLLAGPGSGKTATLAARIKRLLSTGILPKEIVVITFTNNAAREIEERIASLYEHNDPTEREGNRIGYVGTLHGFCLRLLREHGAHLGYGERIAIISPESALDLLTEKAASLGARESIKQLIAIKADGRPDRGRRLTVGETVVASYFDELKEAGIVDFDVLLSEALALLQAGDKNGRIRFEHLLVDEVQDSSSLDWAIYDYLPAENKFFVGDPDQAIYAFRGGDVREIVRRAAQSDVTVIRLEENFRSCSQVCEAANSLIGHNTNRVAKRTISATKSKGAVVTLDVGMNEGEEIGIVARQIKTLLRDYYDRPDSDSSHEAPDPLEIAILAPTNAIAGGFRAPLAAAGIDVVQRRASELPRDWAFARSVVELCVDPENDSLAFFYLIRLYEKRGIPREDARRAASVERQNAASFGRSVNRSSISLPRYKLAADIFSSSVLSDVTAEARMLIAEKFKELPPGASVADLALALASVYDNAVESGDGVNCLTIHASKGREFDIVFLAGFEEEVIPGRARNIMDPDACLAAIEEQRRLAFVALTRSRRVVYISGSLSRVTRWGKVEPHSPSRFLRELSIALQ